MTDQNIRTYEALKHYVNFPTAPMYAIFLSGAWGTGKTFFIKKFIENELSEPDSHIYVSLYGLSTPKDIDNAIFKKIYPIIASKATWIGQRVIKGILGSALKINLDLNLEQLINLPKSKLYIFDDFERCNIPHEQILGYVNNLVEHEKAKAIIIGHEAEITESTTYKIKREKVIGKTFQIVPDFDGAWDNFLANLSSPKPIQCLENFKEEISTIYNKSEINNLRILQQTIWDYTRLYDHFSQHHQSHQEAMRQIIQIFFALSLEVKAGKLSEKELEVRSENWRYSTILISDDDPRFSKLGKLEEKYAPIQISSQIISDKIIIDLLIKGHTTESEILECLNQSYHFASPTLDSWRLVWHGTEIEESIFYEALDDFHNQFELLKYTIPGEIMHVFGLKLWLADTKLVPQSTDQVKAEVTQYIDTLYETDKLEPLFTPQTFRRRWDSYSGLGYMYDHTEDFEYLATHLNNKRLESGIKLHQNFAQAFLDSFEAGTNAIETMLLSRESETPLRALPYMTKVEIPKLINIILELPPRTQQTAISILASRYSEQALEHKLAEEAPWLIDFTNQLLAARNSMSKLSKVRITRLISGLIQPIFDNYPDLKKQISFDEADKF